MNYFLLNSNNLIIFISDYELNHRYFLQFYISKNKNQTLKLIFLNFSNIMLIRI